MTIDKNFYTTLREATLPGILEKPGIWEILKKSGKTWNFVLKSLKKPGN